MSDGAITRASHLAEELRLPVLQWLVTVLNGTRSVLTGHVSDAQKLALEALELSRATDQPDASTWFGVQLYMVRYEQGHLEDLIEMSHAALARAPRLYTWHAALALALTETGRPDEARPIVTELIDVGYPTRRGEPHWHIGMSCLGSAIAALGDPAEVQSAYDALLPSAGRWASIMPLSLGNIDRVLGELALSLRRWDDAAEHFETSIADHDAAPAPGFAARSRLGLMRALLAQDREQERVTSLRAEVQEILDRFDLPRVATLLAEVDALADEVRGAGIYPVVPTQPRSSILRADDTQ